MPFAARGKAPARLLQRRHPCNLALLWGGVGEPLGVLSSRSCAANCFCGSGPGSRYLPRVHLSTLANFVKASVAQRTLNFQSRPTSFSAAYGLSPECDSRQRTPGNLPRTQEKFSRFSRLPVPLLSLSPARFLPGHPCISAVTLWVIYNLGSTVVQDRWNH